MLKALLLLCYCFAQCWGCLEASRGGMFLRLAMLAFLLCYLAAMLVHLAAFSLLLDLGRWSFCPVRVKHKNHAKMRSDK